MRSLQAKLGYGLTLNLIVVFTVLWFLISFGVQYLAEEYITSHLQQDADTLLSKIRFDQQGNMKLDESAIDPIYSQPFSGHYYAIIADGKVISSRSLWDQQLNTARLVAGVRNTAYQSGPEDQLLLITNSGFIKQGYALSIAVAEDFNPVKHSINEFKIRFAITAGVMLLLLVGVQIFILRLGLMSISTIRHDLQSLQQGDTQQLNENVPVELRPLVSEINHLLGVMGQRLRRSRYALGDLAHAIKRPLTVLQQITDKHDKDLSAELKVSLTRQITDINLLTDRILNRARLAGQHYAGVRFSFSQDFPALIDTLGLMYRDKSINTKQLVAENVYCSIDREDMMELLGSLLDNACKWARQTVNVTLSMNPGLTICIEDDGPGADASQLQNLDQRGLRLDETKQGYGLGLAIATDMVREYGGSILFSSSTALGGFRVDVMFPVEKEFSDKGA